MNAEEPGYRDWRGWEQRESYAGAAPRPGDSNLPSRGSAEHALGTCKPCAWVHKPEGCRNGYECAHCHLCPPGASAMRLQARKERKTRLNGRGKGEGKDGKDHGRTEKEADQPALQPESGEVPERPMWSRGTEMHGMPGVKCRPCLFLWTSGGCREGEDCEYCHICVPEKVPEKKPPPPPSAPPDRAQAPAPPPPSPSMPPGNHTLPINLAERIQEPTKCTSVLRTAPLQSATTRPPGASRLNSMNSHMPMGLLETPLCDNCGDQLCICFPGGYGFSAKRPFRFQGEPNGRVNGAGAEVPAALQQSLTNLMQTGGQENLHPPCQGRCTPCLEMMHSQVCSAGDSCQYCHQCVERGRKPKKIGNMSLKKSQKVAGAEQNMWL